MDKIQALSSFWNSFDLIAYDENTVPDDAKLPYITYEVSSDDFGKVLVQTASLWYRSSSWSDITAKEEQIASYITRGGRLVKYSDGAFWIQKEQPWAQRMNDPSDQMIRRIVLNISVEFLD